jgi:hypothetical protein
MRFSILHISDLHRDLRDEVANGPLLDSLARDIERFGEQDPIILKPSVCVVSGDLVYGVKPDHADSVGELERQYRQAEGFLNSLTDHFFEGDRERVVIIPGNHDISFPCVLASSTRIEVPSDPSERKALTNELFSPRSLLRWSWANFCFYRLTDDVLYEKRLNNFAEVYERFYRGARSFILNPEEQFQIFDYPSLGFAIVALNSCYRNDPLRRAGGFNPTAFSAACRDLQHSSRLGWLIAATWHHSVSGGPSEDDFLDVEFLQMLIDAGVSLGFHGHQHSHDCLDERYRLGPVERKITVVSAGTLCAEPRNLKPGVPRGFNVVEVDTDAWRGRVHSRHMINDSFTLPLWGPGHFYATGKSFVDFDVCRPLSKRPIQLDHRLVLDRADHCLGNAQWPEALELLREIKHLPLARPLIVKALTELGDDEVTIAVLHEPSSSAEVVLLGAALLGRGQKSDVESFLQMPIVLQSLDASVKEVVRRLKIRWPQ